MRARMALKYAGIEVEFREIVLRQQPAAMLLASPKGTVPVLCIDGLVLEQSLDIMRWALDQSDPDGWLDVNLLDAQQWLDKNDGPFKILLDQYKYPERFPEVDRVRVLSAAHDLMFNPLELALVNHPYLLGSKMSWVDVAIFPFIRQWSMVKALELALPLPLPRPLLPLTKKWLNTQLESPLFQSVMLPSTPWLEELQVNQAR